MGGGPNLLWLAKNKNLEGHFGGCDYSDGLIKSAKSVLETYDFKELECCEANKMNTQVKYDSVFSMGVFPYFINLDYAYEVLKLMMDKAKYSIGILSIHDLDKEEDYVNYRKQTIENYEERYKDLPKLFYSRNFFLDFAVENELNIKFAQTPIPGYWNNEFVYNVYFWK